MNKPRIYLDYAASTPVDPVVFEAMKPYFTEKYGNPGSLHSFGQEAIGAVDRAREDIAKAIGAEFREIIFTASATEANNIALRGVSHVARHSSLKNPKIIISAVEHESILETTNDLGHEGVEIVKFSNLKDLEALIDERTVLVSLILGQNEMGSIYPIAKVATIVREYKKKNTQAVYPLLHTDASQGFQFLDCNVTALGVDLMTFSSHKIYGPKGAGALYIKSSKMVIPLQTGGGQEFGLRSGTENVPAIVGFAKAVELAVAARESEGKRIASLRDRLLAGIMAIFPTAEINAVQQTDSLPNILNIYFSGRKAEDILTAFDLGGLAVSAGSACRSRALETSYVLEAMGYSKERAQGSIRFSLGRPTTEADIDGALSIIKERIQ